MDHNEITEKESLEQAIPVRSIAAAMAKKTEPLVDDSDGKGFNETTSHTHEYPHSHNYSR